MGLIIGFVLLLVVVPAFFIWAIVWAIRDLVGHRAAVDEEYRRRARIEAEVWREMRFEGRP